MISYIVTIFLSSFLLFQVQPVIARYILPWYGGTPAVWTTCMLFFQLGLLGGYLYAHLIRLHLRFRMQVIVHLILLGAAGAFLPITPSDTLKPTGNENAMLGIMWLLLTTVGLPYFLLSSSAPLLQYWFTRQHENLSPYRLYALSNLGSLLGLLTYPFVIEPLFAIDLQTLIWSVAFLLYAAGCISCAIPQLRLWSLSVQVPTKNISPGAKPSKTDLSLWVLLAACGSIMLLSTTNQICQEVAVIPFLWILPLSLYLMSFIISFDNEKWYDRRFWVPAFLLGVVGTVLLLFEDGRLGGIDIAVQVAVYSIVMFACCMICHGELNRHKPHKNYLTTFYMMIAVGGASGGLFVGLAAPFIFKGFWEFHIGLIGSYLLLGWSVLRCAGDKPWVVGTRRSWRLLWGSGAVVLTFALGQNIAGEQKNTIDASRNFFGVLRVCEMEGIGNSSLRSLLHGGISHGAQFLDPDLRRRPIAYYGPESGVAVAFNGFARIHGLVPSNPQPRPPLNVGVIGLGAGGMCPYGQTGDVFRIYEINKDVLRMAKEYFFYLSESSAACDIVIGDARVSLERELVGNDKKQFDMLFVDAFSGDAIPIHLLTREAFSIYWKHLTPKGILAVNITNRHIDLRPVLLGMAQEFKKVAVLVTNEYEDEAEIWAADWVIITDNEVFLENKYVKGHSTPLSDLEIDPLVWTDDFSNLLAVLQ